MQAWAERQPLAIAALISGHQRESAGFSLFCSVKALQWQSKSWISASPLAGKHFVPHVVCGLPQSHCGQQRDWGSVRGLQGRDALRTTERFSAPPLAGLRPKVSPSGVHLRKRWAGPWRMKSAPPCEVTVKCRIAAGTAQTILGSGVCGTVSLRCENVC